MAITTACRAVVVALTLVGQSPVAAAAQPAPACPPAKSQQGARVPLGVVRPGETVTQLVQRTEKLLADRAMSWQGASLVLDLALAGRPPSLDAHVEAFACEQSGAGVVPVAGPSSLPIENAPGPSPAERVTSVSRTPLEISAAQGSHPPRELAAPKRLGPDIPGPTVVRVLGTTNHVELFRVAVPGHDSAGDLAHYDVIRGGIVLSDDEIRRLRELLLQNPAAWPPTTSVRACPPQPELMFEARGDLPEGGFETVRIVLSRSCVAFRFLVDADPMKSNGIAYYSDPIQPGLDEFLADVFVRTGAAKEPPPPVPTSGIAGTTP